MVNIRATIRANQRFIARATADIDERTAEIQMLQAACQHNWKFKHQTNNFHDLRWNVFYKCTKCGCERVDEDRPPVCSIHNNLSLVRAKRWDRGAEGERRKEKYQGRHNPPRAYRCPRCRKIHILWVEGD